MRNRECIKKPSTRIGGTFSEKDNFARISYPQVDNTRLTWFFYDNGKWVSMETTPNSTKKEDSGTWECNGNENFKIFAGNFTYMSDIDDWVESTTDDSDFSCILKNKGDKAKIDSNGESAWFWVDEPNRIAHIFYKKDNKWIQSKNGVEQFVGRWNCDEDNHFLIVTDDESYSSRSNNWEEISRVGDSNDNFPLKLKSEGPNVVKLQKFLNDKIPGNPLTVNGIFDQKTADKLIEFQKKEGIIE
jgi:hypothetical protein